MKNITIKLFTDLLKLLSLFSSKNGWLICAPPSGAKNKGDEALLLSLLQEIKDKKNVYILQTGFAPLDFLKGYSDLKSIAKFKQVFNTCYCLWDRILLCRFLMNKRHLIIIGADLLDAGYGGERSFATLWVGAIARKMGLMVTVNSFSMKTEPDAKLKKALSEVSEDGSRFWCRDPKSRDRLVAAGFTRTHLTADLAFLLEPSQHIVQDFRDHIESVKKSCSKLVGININPISLNLYPHGPEKFRELLCLAMTQLYKSKGYHFLLLPSHSPDDTDFMLPLLEDLIKIDPSIAKMITPVPSAKQVKRILGECEHVFTGRLHIAILTLGTGRPVTCFPYQGKFEGQLEHFNLSHCIFSSQHLPCTTKTLIEFLESRIVQSENESKIIKESLPAVLTLSRKNIENY